MWIGQITKDVVKGTSIFQNSTPFWDLESSYGLRILPSGRLHQVIFLQGFGISDCWPTNGPWQSCDTEVIRLMAEILHQSIGSLSHYL